MESRELDLIHSDTPIYRAIQEDMALRKRSGVSQDIREMGITFPLGKDFKSLENQINQTFENYRWNVHAVVIVHNKKKWLLTKIRYGA